MNINDAEPMYLRYFTDEVDFPFFIQNGFHEKKEKWHTHGDFYELMIVKDGTSMQRVNDQVFFISPGDVFIFGENAAHDFYDARDLHICNIMFSPAYMYRNYLDTAEIPGFHALFKIEPFRENSGDFKNFLRLNVNDMEQVKYLTDAMYREYNESRTGTGRKDMIIALFTELTILLSRKYSEQTSEHADENTVNIAMAVSFMEQNFKNEISNKKLADIAHLSVRQFVRKFGNIYHISPHSFIISLRLQYACRLLENSSRTDDETNITEIAFNSGFNSSSYFSRAFKNVYGITPAEYKRRLDPV